MTNAEKFTIKEMLEKLMEKVDSIVLKIDAANEKQDLKIEANTIFRRNTIAILKVLVLVVSGLGTGITFYFFGP